MEQPCAEIVHVGRDGGLMFSEQTLCGVRANVWRNANSRGAWATLCGDRACRMPKTFGYNPNFVARSRTT